MGCGFEADNLRELLKSQIQCGETVEVDTSGTSGCVMKPAILWLQMGVYFLNPSTSLFSSL